MSAKRPRQWGALLECRARCTVEAVSVMLPDGSEVDLVEGAEALSSWFGRPVAIESFERAGQGSYAADWPEIDGFVWSGRENLDFEVNLAGDQSTGFVDVFPIHFITTSALALLRSEDPDLIVDERRFRPTMVLDTGSEPGLPENDWVGRQLHIGTTSFVVTAKSLRCVMATSAQGDLPRQTSVLKTLARINGEQATMHDGERGRIANFGIWADVAHPGVVSNGDAVHLSD